MINHLQTKMLFRKITASKGRFIAIILIIMLGVMLFVGIKSVGPDLYKNAQIYLNRQNASDIHLTSTTGLTAKDIRLAKKVAGANITASKAVFVLDEKNNDQFQVNSITKNSSNDEPRVIIGRMPSQNNEILLDDTAQKAGYKLNQKVKFNSNSLNRQSYKIVGFATSPQFINKHARPSSNLGDGVVDYFALVNDNNFKGDIYSTITFRFARLSNLNSFKADYRNEVTAKIREIKKIFGKRESTRQSELLTEIEANDERILTNLNQLVAQNLGDSQSAQKLLATREQLATSKKNLQAHQTRYLFTTRDDLAGFTAYGDLSEQISVIANVFPLFFFLIAILITFTTMTRMVEEERTQIGTLKALGYKKREIGRNYIFYALFAAVIGIIFGSVIGINTLPKIVTTMMTNQFVFTDTGVTFELGTILIAALLALLATIGAVLLVTTSELQVKPANLMLKKSPKAGKRLLLERVQPLWQRLSFNRKVSYRNLFRFKSRMWMGIIGIAGGAGLILTGFGIRDSIGSTSQNQFGNVISYQAIATLNAQTKLAELQDILAADTKNVSHLAVQNENVQLETSGKKVNAVTLMVTKNPQRLADFVKVKPNRLKNGVLVSTKTADILNLEVGDRLSVIDNGGQKIQVRVGGIAENYLGHFMYMSADYFDKVSPDNYVANSWLLKYDYLSKKNEEELATKLLDQAQVVNVTYLSTQKKMLTDQTASLNPIIAVFVLLSGLLTFIVLYNLTNINISERIRELSTIKVLGFYNREVTMYIVRENIVLTIFGILLGGVFGNALLWFILQQAMTDQVIFPLTIGWQGYLTAVFLTIFFTFVVMVATHRKLKNIDMIDALKANE